MVFGSNLQGIHQTGDARFAQQYRGAQAGVGEGWCGRSYALPVFVTPTEKMPNLLLMNDAVGRFVDFARCHPQYHFMVLRSALGCGTQPDQWLDEQVYPLVQGMPDNCVLPGIWQSVPRLIIAGSRGVAQAETLGHLQDWSSAFAGEVVSGMAQGVDTWGQLWARSRQLPVVEVPALWNVYGKSAGFIRNTWMAWYGTHLMAIWDGESRGTRQMIQTARAQRLYYDVILTDDSAGKEV